MSQNTDTLEHERGAHPAQPHPPTLAQIREALTRLREVGEKLPPVDAVAIIRESRDLSAQENR
jgi:hypothetical protein